MTDKKVPLAVRRRAGKQLKTVENYSPIRFVLPPIAKVLNSIQAIAGAELDQMMVDQNQGQRLDLEGAKKLGALTNAVVQAHKAEQELSSAEASGLSDEELARELIAAIEEGKDETP